MFGYVRANLADLSEAEKTRYRAVYCGLCHTLHQRHGWRGRLTLTYDMTFLCLFLSSLYEPEEKQSMARCVPHPLKEHACAQSAITDYAADMTIALAYHKCLDDWQDDGKQTARVGASLLSKRYQAVQAQWPVQIETIERCMRELALVEKRRDASPDAAANCFGELMGALFVMKEDFWKPALSAFGQSLGRFIYMVDAACDYDKDQKAGSYNPVILMDRQPESMRDTLVLLLGQASAAFEALPLVNDVQLMRNILYSGIWQSYNETMEKRKEGDKHGG